MKKQIIIILSALLFLAGCAPPHYSLNNGQWVQSSLSETQEKKVFEETNGEFTLVKSVYPIYPVKARKEGIEGRVIVSFLVNKKGKPEDIQVTKSAGELLDKACLDAISKWRFLPILDGQERLIKRLNMLFDFKLED
ncbi:MULTISPECIES: energy transducer TonB [Marinomonas]|uniref:Protein TonB n=1 Tax=Marinomonas rhodophyticola TaxID=2992803 RepID=A0ABT3KMM5_9GAMM|nr:energy transducer TonB [Marinomonas sp. KJ51-3]MCW4631624.1 energy transducer TonB [Marinomonas sp. KJ51-3]